MVSRSYRTISPMMKRIIAVFMTVLTALPLANVPMARAESVTGPWTWTDISGQLTERNNRPMWAVAYANGSWFYTDGQDLWSGGQVYRYDGTTQINITSDVRNNGVNRVDDIVSDGQTVLFLQDVVRQDDAVKVTAYKNGQYLNITSTVQNALNSNEGVSSITGRNGTWYIVTTQQRLFRWDGTSSNPTQIGLPGGVVNQLDASPSSLLYSVTHGSGVNGRIGLAMIPVANNNWLLAADPNNGQVRFYRYDGSVFNDITATNGLNNVDVLYKMVSNGTQAFLSVYGSSHNPQTSAVVTDGSTVVSNSTPGSLSNALIAWNNTSWFVINGKDLYRFSGAFANNGSYTSLGGVADFFDTIATDGNGRILLGGALSYVGTSQPSFPLTAKLVMVTEGVSAPNTNNGGTYGGNRVYSSAYGPTVTVQGDPSDFRVGNGKEFSYRASATDTNGVDHTDIYVNDALIKTCYSDVCEYRTTYFTNGASQRSVKFWVRSTDRSGNQTVSSGSPDYLTVDENSSNNAGGNNGGNNSDTGINSWTWLDPNTTTLNDNQTITYNVGAQDNNGINRIEMYVNGAIARTCTLNNSTANQTCSTTLYANNYSAGTSIAVNAKITDGSGNTAWTSLTTIYRSSGTSTGGNGTNTVSVWVDPSSTILYNNQSVTFNASSQDSDGVTQIDLYVNGSIIRTCTFTNYATTQNCNISLYANNYTAGSNVALNARALDRYGNSTWSSTTTLTRSNDGSNNGGTQTGSVSVWSWLDQTSDLRTDASTQVHATAWAANGLSSIELWVNGGIARTCNFSTAYGNQNCDTTIYGSSYTAGSNVSVNAKAKDMNGNTSWSTLQTLNIVGTGTTTPPPTTGGTNNVPSVWEWFEPSVDHIATNGTITYGVGAWDADGVRSITVYVNGTAKPVCNFYPGYGNQECKITLNGSSFTAGTNVFVNAVAKDPAGNTSWTQGKTFRIDGTNGSTGGTTNTNGTVSVLTSVVGVYRANDTITFTTSGSDNDGIDRVELYVNASKVKTCTGTAVCTLTQGPFSSRAVVTYGAVLYDRNGNSTSSGFKQLTLAQ
jgi:hypothetical protein